MRGSSAASQFADCQTLRGKGVHTIVIKQELDNPQETKRIEREKMEREQMEREQIQAQLVADEEETKEEQEVEDEEETTEIEEEKLPAP